MKAPFVLLFIVSVFAACGPSAATPSDAPPDASTIPKSPVGTFTLAGTLDLQVLPAPADALVAELTNATDSPDDPAQFLCDQLVTELPASWQAIAAGVADVVIAPYLETEIDSVAPDFSDGIRSLAAGLGDLAHHVQTTESLAVEPGGYATRTVTGVAYSGVQIDFANEGMSDAIASTTVTIDTHGALAIGATSLALPYGRLLRLGFDRAIVPNVVFGADDLAGALEQLVDCDSLGELFAAKIGVGSVALYRDACEAGMIALATDFYDRLATIDTSPFELAATGAAVGIDLDGDGVMDRIQDGVWIGTSSYAGASAPLIGATFTGSR